MGHCGRWHGHKISETNQLKRVIEECWAQLILNRLIPGCQRMTMVIYCPTANVEFRLNYTCVNDCCYFTVCWWKKSTYNPCVTVNLTWF